MLPTLFDPARPVFIVGGGASLTDFDFGRLKRRQVLALNLAYRVVPWADAMFFGDNRFWEDNRDPSGQHFHRFGKGRIFTTASHCGGMSGRVQFLRHAEIGVNGVDGTDMNTGAQAILLASKLGAGQIVLLGFDGKPGSWAADKPYRYPSAPSPEAFERYAADLTKIAGLGVDVVNATPGSALTCFPTASLDTLL